MRRDSLYYLALMAMLLLSACRDDDVIFIPERVDVSQPEFTSVAGFYLLNEGNMGSNKATLDRYDYGTGVYERNIFGNANPTVPKEMGDVGNDLGIYGGKLYAVINCSNKVDVMDAASARKVGQIDIPNCRYIRFHDGYAYVSSYAGPVVIDPDYEQRGFVAKVDTTTLQVVDTCVVGFQPDGLEIVGGRLYVANSGGYMVPNYENTLSVIDLASFSEVERVPIAINLQLVLGDRRGILWVVSRGDYYDETSDIYAYDTRKRRIVGQMHCPASNCWMDGDSLYVISNQWDAVTAKRTVSYAIVNTASLEVVNRSFITDGTEADIRVPYGIAVNPVTKDILITDARNYVSPGYLLCYSADGVLKWRVRTGDIPAHFAFYGQTKRQL